MERNEKKMQPVVVVVKGSGRANLNNIKINIGFRILIGQALLSLFLLLEGLELVRLQAVLPSKILSGKVPKNMRREIAIAKRGTIYARDMTPLAITVIRYSICCDPTLVKDRDKTALVLSSILNEPYKDIIKNLHPSRDGNRAIRFRWIKRDVDAQVAERLLQALRKEKLNGIFVSREARRIYPCGRLASQLIGFVNVDGTVKEGIEHKWDATLSGSNGIRIVEVNARGEPIPGGESEIVEPIDGRSLMLTIDPAIQREVELVLRKAIERHDPKAAIAAVMEVRTGEMLASASLPDFDPNQYNKARQEDFQSRVAMFAYEPGSVFKVIIAAIGIECGVINEDSTAYCNGKWRLGSSTITCWVSSGHGRQTIADAIRNSCNVAMAQFAMRIPRESLWRYLLKFGFGKPTKCGVPESPGWIDPPEVWDKVRHANLGYGYGIMATPLQMLSAIGIIARGGLMLKPTFIKAIDDGNGRWQLISNGEKGEYVISPTAAMKVRKMMEFVVLKGTGKRASVEGYSCAGKTGTTRKMIPNRGYGSDVICTFAGFLPSDSPGIAAIVVLDEPQKGKWASETAAPLFSELMSRIALHLNIPPSHAVILNQPEAVRDNE